MIPPAHARVRAPSSAPQSNGSRAGRGAEPDGGGGTVAGDGAPGDLEADAGGPEIGPTNAGWPGCREASSNSALEALAELVQGALSRLHLGQQLAQTVLTGIDALTHVPKYTAHRARYDTEVHKISKRCPRQPDR